MSRLSILSARPMLGAAAVACVLTVAVTSSAQTPGAQTRAQATPAAIAASAAAVARRPVAASSALILPRPAASAVRVKPRPAAARPAPAASVPTSSIPVYPSPHVALVEAIEQGRSAGIVTGPVAKKMRDQFRTDGATLIAVRVVGTFTRRDCRRLQVRLLQKDALDSKGMQSDVTFNIGMNYCVDGSAPAKDEQPMMLKVEP